MTLHAEVGPPLVVTRRHGLYSQDRDGWVPAEDLLAGERVQTFDGNVPVRIVDRAAHPRMVVYNLEVFDQHSFYVGIQRIRAHNSCAELAEKAVELGGQSGRSVFGETMFRGLVQNRGLRELTDTEVRNAFAGTQWELTNHAVSRLLDIRTLNLGLRTLNDVARVLNSGVIERAGRGLFAVRLGGFEAVVDATKVAVVTFRPI